VVLSGRVDRLARPSSGLGEKMTMGMSDFRYQCTTECMTAVEQEWRANRFRQKVRAWGGDFRAIRNHQVNSVYCGAVGSTAEGCKKKKSMNR